MNDPDTKQDRYYTETASQYDEKHVREGDEHQVALEFIMMFMERYNMSSALDVGSGTGRALAFFTGKNIQARGIEPVKAMIDQAVHKNGLSPKFMIQGNGNALPFPDNSFDVVCSFGIFHHISTPRKVIREMIRVARKAVFISDNNRFGHGPRFKRWLKLGLYAVRLWKPLQYIKTRGKRYSVSEGDGVVFSYSVYDSYNQLAQWADYIFAIPTVPSQNKSWFHPLLTSTHVLLGAIKK